MVDPLSSSPLGNDYFARFDQPLASGDPLVPQAQPEDDMSFLEAVADVARAPLAGIASAAEGLVEVGNILPGLDYDYEFNRGIFADSETMVGGFLQGTTQFLTGFIPVGGALSRVGAGASKARKIAQATRVRRLEQGVSASAKVKASQILERAARMSGKTSQYRRSMYGKSMAQGALADFLVFSEDEARLSNMLQEIPGLEENLLLEFLAQDDEDSALTSRLKAVFEGAGLGLAVEGLVNVLRGIGRRSKIVQRAKGEEEARRLLEANEAFIEESAEDALVGRQAAQEAEAPIVADEPSALDEAVGAEADVVETQPIDPRVQELESAAGAFEAKLVEKYGGLEFAKPRDRAKLRKMRHEAEDVARGEPLSNVELLERKAKDYEEELIVRRGSVEKATKGERAYLTGLQNKAKRRGASEGLAIDQPTPFGEESYRQRRPETQRVAESAQEAVAYGGVGPDRAAEIIRAADEAFESGEDLLDTRHQKIPGVMNLAMLGSDANRGFLQSYLNDFEIRNGVDEFGKPLPKEQIGKNPTANRPRGRGAQKSFLEAQAEESSVVFLERALGRSPQEITAALERMAVGQREISTMYAAAGKYIDNYISDMDMLRLAAKGQDVVLPNGRKMTNADFLNSQNLKSQDAAAIAYQEAEEALGELLRSFGSVRREGGRNLRAMGQRSAAVATPEFIEARLKAMGGRERILNNAEALAMMRKELGTSAMVQKLLHFDKKQRFYAMMNEVFVNNILSAPRTLSTNLFGNMGTAIYGPLETLVGAAVSKGARQIMGRDATLVAKEMQRATDELMQLAEQFGTAWAYGRKAWRQKDYILDAGQGTLDLPEFMQTAVNSQNFGYVIGKELDPSKGLGLAVEKFGNVIRTPSRALMATDEFFKQWQYRSSVSADLMFEGRIKKQEGEIDDIDLFVERELRAMTRRGQAFTQRNLQAQAMRIYRPDMDRYKNATFPLDALQADRDAWVKKQMQSKDGVDRGEIAQRALEKARERTFTNDLDPDGGFLSSVGITAQRLGTKHPWFRLFVPFIRTPMNILLYASRRTALPGVNKDLYGAAEYMYRTRLGSKNLDAVKTKMAQQLASKDARVQADAMGRMMSALGFSSLALGMVASNRITGAGPKDKRQRDLLAQTGWQPYSIKVGDTYVSYQKLDPFATMLGIFADIGDAGRYAPPEEQGELAKLMMGAVASVANNIQSKSYLQGLVQASGILTDPDVTVSKTTGRLASAFMVPAFVAAGRDLTDPQLREVRGPLDQIISRIPFLSDSLDPQRNILGEPVDKKTFGGAGRTAADLSNIFLPTMINTTTDDVVSQELADLAYPFDNPSRFKYSEDLSTITNDKGQSAYDRWMELTGSVKIGYGQRRNLRSAMRRLIQSNYYQQLPTEGVSELDVDSPRVQEIQNLLNRYRSAALRQMLTEFPELERTSRAQRLAKIASRRGQSPEAIRNQLFPLE